MLTKIKNSIFEYKRVLSITQKQGLEEFKNIVKVSGLGIAIIGGIGFLIHIIWTLIK